MKTKKRVIEDLWNSYRERVIPEHAPSVQIEECKTAFYCGAIGVFYSIVDAAECENGEPSEFELGFMDGIHDELEEFKQGL